MKNSLIVFTLSLFAVLSVITHSCSTVEYSQGRELYNYYCSSCHLESGQGLRSLYPPLANSDYLAKFNETVPCIIREGMEGQIKVNGKEYEMPMPAMPKITAFEITNIMNYINHNFGNDLPFVKFVDVKAKLEECK